jgi:hypothetical protein
MLTKGLVWASATLEHNATIANRVDEITDFFMKTALTEGK